MFRHLDNAGQRPAKPLSTLGSDCSFTILPKKEGVQEISDTGKEMGADDPNVWSWVRVSRSWKSGMMHSIACGQGVILI